MPPISAEEPHTTNYEDIAKLAQRIAAQTPVVILGTGATIPHGLPSMPTLAQAVLDQVPENLAGWPEIANQLRDTQDLEIALNDVSIPDETVDAIVRTTWNIVTMADLRFHRKLLSEALHFPLAELFQHLLRTASARIHVVTTNYDRLAEYAANVAQGYADTGMTPGWLQRFDPRSIKSSQPRLTGFEGFVSVLKVHGSLDWFRNTQGVPVAVPLSHSVPDRFEPQIVTPGISKYREAHKEPFRSVMTAADEVLRTASSYLCIGYGFNDEHVQPILEQRIATGNIPVVLITKTLTEKARTVLLNRPPKHFLIMEESPEGTIAYTPEHPDGLVLPGVSNWKLDAFMGLITGRHI